LVDTIGFKSHVPPNIIPGAQAARDALNEIRKETELDWTFLSPAAMLQPGERKGTFRIGADDLLTHGDQPGSISVQDLAVAIVDELEKPRHIRRRFTVAY
jgi:putative NADH-flavin reductase